ncbi:glycosyltransferase family 2 protein [uncultured Bacteroides sp.]|uniref:glycosyltransferase family 2 protein n=1 Tax=uncultured Bacteroides sp. TaxID=162156 RepID=UPI00260D79CF|nr:glycosyltransferase family 2 protein [uncultured Bacteroides sp.]
MTIGEKSMGKILTISIAAYNVEQYIGQALDSLIDERIIDDLEIFVVDDGGTDKTLDIAKRYAEKYPDSIFPVHKENGGYGSTINTSVRLATGKYFKQLDGDDWFDKDNLYRFVELLKTIDVDMVATESITFNVIDNTQEKWSTTGNLKAGEYNFNDIILGNVISMYSSTFRTSIFKNNNIVITEHCFYTDVEYASLPIPYVNRFYVCCFPIYCYRVGREGQSVSIEGIKKHFKEQQKVLFNLMRMYMNIDNISKNKQNLLLKRIVIETANQFKYLCYLPMSKSSYNEIKDFYKKVNESYPAIIQIVLKEKLFVKLFAYTNGFAYPLMRFITILYLKGLLKPILKLKRLLKK